MRENEGSKDGEKIGAEKRLHKLQNWRHRVIPVANPLRGVKHDADYFDAILESIDGPIVLVGHSYGSFDR